MATTDFCDGDYLGAYRRFLEHFVANVARADDQLPVKMGRRDVRDFELPGEIADITLQHLNQRVCPPSLQAYLVKLVINEFKIMFQKSPEECGYRPQDKVFSPLKLMQTVTSKVNEICQRYLDNSRLALLPPPPSTPLPLVSSYAIKNRRRKMEDRSVVLHDLHTIFSIKNDAVVNYYAVFDGHGGQEAAVYCAAHLHQYLIESPHYPADLELALRDAFHTTDHRFIQNSDTKDSGATAVCALLYDKTLYIAWAGDSQAAIIKNGRGINLTIPHKPERPDERKRIENLGGEVIHYGTWRVNGILNVSRAIGDAKYKPFISDEPDIKRIDLDGTEDFLIIACDGFWERATEEIVASLLYEYVGSSHSDYNSASEALVLWAKQNLSDDNISVIVVFLTPPGEIAAKHFFDPRPVQSAMEPSFQQQEHPLYDLENYGFAAKQQQQQPQSNGSAEDNNGFGAAASFLEPINGRHRPKPPKYNDEDDDEDEDEDAEDVDLGPETNVDQVDDAPEEFGKMDEAMEMMVERNDDEFPLEIKKRHQNELIAEADNVADSEDSEDEWNYYRPDENSGSSDNKAVEIAKNGPSKDPALVEKPDQCEEEKEPCSPKPFEDDNSTPAIDELCASPAADDVTAEFDELHETEPTKESREHELELKETDAEAEAATAPEEDLPFDQEEQPQFEQQQPQQPEEISDEDQQNEDNLADDMESHLNPEAAEFVPTSTSPTMFAQRDLLDNDLDLVAGSPLKQSQRALKNRKIPSEEEFQKEIANRPAELDDSISDFSNGEQSPQKDALGGFDYSGQKTVLLNTNLDDSEVSSTKAEFGDESNYSVASEFYKTGVSNIDASYTDSERADFDMMVTSMTPGDFKNAFEQEVDLNKVHELHDEDLMDVPQNGSYRIGEKEDPEMIVDDDDIPKTKFDLDMDNLVPQQEQNAEIFSAIVEERESDNKDLFMNIRNNEHGFELDHQGEKPQEQNNLIEAEMMEQEQIKAPEADKLGFSSEEVPTYASNNPFASDYVSAVDEPEDDTQNLTEELENINLNQQPTPTLLFDNNAVLTPEDEPLKQQPEPEVLRDDVMLNPLDLNIGASSVELKSDELVLVSPVKDPEIMNRKFEEENLMCKAEEVQQFNQTPEPVQEPILESNHMHDFTAEQNLLENKTEPIVDEIVDMSPTLEEEFVDKQKDILLVEENITIPSPIEENRSFMSPVEENRSFMSPVEEPTAPVTSVEETLERKSINLSESLQEFTGLEEQLSPKQDEVKDNEPIIESQPILKENLVEEPKDVEEVASPPVVETKLEEVPVVTNEPPVAVPEPAVEVAAVAAAAAAITATAVAATAASKPAAKTSAVSKTSKPAASKTTTKSTTPTSPTKTGIAAKTSTAAKKSTTTASTITRTKTAPNTANKTSASSTLTKTTATTKSSIPPTKTSTVNKAAPRTSTTTTTAPKTKPLSSVTSKISSTSTADKKPIANGTAKPAPKSTTSGTTSKTGLVKPTTNSRMSIGSTGTAAAAAKSRPTSATTKTTTSKPTTTNVSSSINSSTAARPKTAPSSTLNVKSKIGSTKSPMLDKQIKETANKQISSARSATASTPKRLSATASVTSTTTTTKRMSLVQKQSVSAPVPSPTKKPAPITKPGTKTATSKVNSKVTSTTKSNTTATTKVVQNGVCETEETKITTTTTTNIEEDIPKKDVSPIEPVTDNQLITAE